MKALVLYGAKCSLQVWDPLRSLIQDPEIEYVEYPHEVLLSSYTIEALSSWVPQAYPGPYDVVIGHSMGGLIALDIASKQSAYTKQVILIESNLKPANAFYRNFMMPEATKKYGDSMNKMLKEESIYYPQDLMNSLQEDFDYSDLVRQCRHSIIAIYGDRGNPTYEHRITDFNLEEDVLQKMSFYFLKDCCHMPMVEQCVALANLLKELCPELGSIQ